MECQKLQQFKKTGTEGKMKELKRVEARQLLLGVTLIGIFASVPWLCGGNTAGSGFSELSDGTDFLPGFYKNREK